MIFAQMEYPDAYFDFHMKLENHLRSRFKHIESGLQGDSWFWILDGDEKVAIDTFSSMKHQVKSVSSGQHVQRVVEALQNGFTVHVYSTPKLEPHE